MQGGPLLEYIKMKQIFSNKLIVKHYYEYALTGKYEYEKSPGTQTTATLMISIEYFMHTV